METVLPFIIAVQWALAVVLIALVFMVVFRREIGTLIKSVNEAQFAKNVFLRFWKARVDFPRNDQEIIADVEPAGNLNKPASLFWLGSDLEWTTQTALRGAPKERIIHGLMQACHHATGLGLANSTPGKELEALKNQVLALSQAALDRQWRDNFAAQMESTGRKFDAILRRSQPDFKPGPPDS